MNFYQKRGVFLLIPFLFLVVLPVDCYYYLDLSCFPIWKTSTRTPTTTTTTTETPTTPLWGKIRFDQETDTLLYYYYSGPGDDSKDNSSIESSKTSTGPETKFNLRNLKQQGSHFNTWCELNEARFRKRVLGGKFRCPQACVLHQFGIINWTPHDGFMMGSKKYPSEEYPDPTIVSGLLRYFRIKSKDVAHRDWRVISVIQSMARYVVESCRQHYGQLILNKKLPCERWGPLYKCVENVWNCGNYRKFTRFDPFDSSGGDKK